MISSIFSIGQIKYPKINSYQIDAVNLKAEIGDEIEIVMHVEFDNASDYHLNTKFGITIRNIKTRLIWSVMMQVQWD